MYTVAWDVGVVPGRSGTNDDSVLKLPVWSLESLVCSVVNGLRDEPAVDPH